MPFLRKRQFGLQGPHSLQKDEAVSDVLSGGTVGADVGGIGKGGGDGSAGGAGGGGGSGAGVGMGLGTGFGETWAFAVGLSEACDGKGGGRDVPEVGGTGFASAARPADSRED